MNTIELLVQDTNISNHIETLLFQNNEFCSQLRSLGVDEERMRTLIKNTLISSLAKIINRTELIEQAKEKRIKYYKSLSKNQIIEQLWFQNHEQRNKKHKRIKKDTENNVVVPVLPAAMDVCRNEVDEVVLPLLPAMDVCRNEEVNECRNEEVVPLELCRNEVVVPAMVKYHFKAESNIVVSASPAKDACRRNEAVVSVLPATNVCRRNEAVMPASPAKDVCRRNEAVVSVLPATNVCHNEAVMPALPATNVCHNEAVMPALPATNDEPIVPPSPAIDEYRCSICHLHINLRRCNVLYKYCEKHERYSVDRVPNTVYDLYYNKWLPVASNVAHNHYADIEEQRAKIRAFDVGHANSSFSVSALYMKHLTRIAMYYPSLMTETQKDFQRGINMGNAIGYINEEMIRLLPA